MRHKTFLAGEGGPLPRRVHEWQLTPGAARYVFMYDARDRRGSGMRLSYAHHLRDIRRKVPDILRRATQ